LKNLYAFRKGDKNINISNLKEGENTSRKHIVVSGRVQGVGFRYHVHRLAEAYHLTGWVSNLDSGDVELEVQGYQTDMEQFILKLDKGSMFIHIDHMEVLDLKEIRESGFVVKS
jgi:acylphosphatase